MPSEQETLDRILNIVRFKSKGMTITELSRHTNIHRNSIAKYLQILLASGKVDVQLIGNAKVYTISRRVPLNSMLSYSSDLIMIINQERKVIHTNERFLNFFELSMDDTLHKDLDELGVPMLSLEEIQSLIEKGFEDGERSGYEIFFDKDEREYNFYINIIPVVLEGGGKGITILIMDYTDQKIAEDAMVESEEKYRNLFNYALDSIFLYEINQNRLIGNLLEVNEVAPKILQYSYDELLNLPAESVILPDNWDISTQMDSQLAENYNSIFEGFLLRKDSEKIPVEISSQIFELNNKLVVLFIVRDITKWKEAQKKLEISEKRYKAIVETQTEFICRQYPDGTFNYVNDAFCTYFGKKREEILGKNQFICGELRVEDKIISKIESLTPQNPSADYQLTIKVEDDARWVQWVTLAIFDEKDEIIEYQSVGRDITSQKKVEEALRQSEETARILLDESKSSAILIDSDGIILRSNLSASNYSDAKTNPGESIKGRHYSEVFDNRCHDDFEKIIKLSSSERKDGKFKKEYDGKVYQYTFYPISDSINNKLKIAVFKNDITEIKKIEADLTNSVKRLADIIEFLPEATFVIDTNKTVTAWNKAMENLTGVKKEEIVGEADLYSLPFFGEKKSMLADKIIDKMTGCTEKQFSDNSITVTTKCGPPDSCRDLYIFAKASCIFNEKGEVAGAIETISDITEFKKTKDDLEKSEMRYRAIVEDQTDMLCRFSVPSMKISFVNHALCKNFDLSHEQLTDEDISIIFPENVCRRVQKYSSLLPGDEKNLHYETRIIEKGGSSRWQEWKIHPVFGGNENIVECQCVGRDITAKKEAEKKLKESEEKYRFLIEKSKSIIIKLSNSGCITYFNKFAEDFYGYQEKEVIGEKFAGFIAPSTESTGRDLEYLISHVCKNPNNYSKDENENVTKDGRIKWVSWSFSAIEENGIQDGVLCVGQDITDRKNYEENTKKARAELNVLSRSASVLSKISDENEFYRYISSEIKNVVPYAALLITGYSKDSGRYVPKIIRGDIDECEMLLENMFDINLKSLSFSFNENYRKLLLSGDLVKSEGGFYDMFHMEISEQKCDTVNKIMNVGRCYTKGLISNDDLLGTISFVLKKGESLDDTTIIDVLASHAASFVQKFSDAGVLLEKITGRAEKIVGSPELFKESMEYFNQKKNRYLEDLITMERQMSKNCLNCIEKAMVGVDVNGNILRINKVGCSILGCKEEAAIGKSLYNYFPEDIRSETEKMHHELTNGSNIKKMSVSSEMKNETFGDQEILWDANKITDDFGNTISLLWVGNI